MEARMTIGRVASAAALSVQAVRYYERRGLVRPTTRTRGGYRQFTREIVPRLQFIRHAQTLGFTLQEIGELLGLRVQTATACRVVEQKTRKKIDLVRQRISDLRRIERSLSRLAASCAARRLTDHCPILEVLDHGKSDG